MICFLLLLTILLAGKPKWDPDPEIARYSEKNISVEFDDTNMIEVYNKAYGDSIDEEDITSIKDIYSTYDDTWVLVASVKSTDRKIIELGFVGRMRKLFTLYPKSHYSDNDDYPAAGESSSCGCHNRMLDSEEQSNCYKYYAIESYSIGFFRNCEPVSIDNTKKYDDNDEDEEDWRLSWAFYPATGGRSKDETNPSDEHKSIWVFLCLSFIGNECVSCIKGYAVDSNHVCKPCYLSCDRCDGLTAQNCINNECAPGYIWDSSAIYSSYNCFTTECRDSGCERCYNQENITTCLKCKPTFALTTTTKPNSCSSCVANCSTCTAPNSNACLSCLPGTYLNGNRCDPCHAACLECFGGAITNCYTCKTPYTGTNIVFIYNCTMPTGCFANCAVCISSAQTDCLKCTSEAFALESSITLPSKCLSCTSPCDTCSLNITTCLTCISNYYKNGTSCIKCSTNCQECFVAGIAGCSTCIAPYTDNITGFNCTENCSALNNGCLNRVGPNDVDCVKCNTYYVFQDSSIPSKCVLCPGGCLTCIANSTSACTSCRDGFYLNGSLCLACHSACAKCSGQGADNCIQCSNLYSNASTNVVGIYNCTKLKVNTCENNCAICLKDSPTGNCVKCDSGYYLASNTYPSTCTICPTQCNTCVNASYCLTCKTGNYFANFACIACSTPCLTCSGQGPDNCLTCSATYPTSEGNFLCTKTASCFSTSCANCIGPLESDCVKCKSTFTLETINVPNKCQSCSPSCLECIGSPNASTSVSCLSCPDGQYLSGITCSNCHSSCSECTSAGPGGCTVCATGFTTGLFKGFLCTKIVSCITNCIQCVGILAGDCLECSNNFALTTTNLPNTCSACITPCQTCSYPSTSFCLTCKDKYYLSGTQCLDCHASCGTCNAPGADHCTLTICASGYTYNASSLFKCMKSDSNCESGCHLCVDSAVGSCIECKNGFTLSSTQIPASCTACSPPCATCFDDNTHSCKSCEDNYFLSGTSCLPCHISCRTCSGEGASKCLTCRNTHVNITAGTYSPYYCILSTACASNCATCLSTSASECLVCSTYYSLDGLAPNTCIHCLSPCSECLQSSKNYCSACISHYFLMSNACIQCHASCLQCNGPQPLNCSGCATNYASDSLFPSYCVTTLASTCDSKCSKCIGPGASECMECKNGYYLSGGIAPSFCGVCSSPCLWCSISSNNCTKCESGHVLIGNSCPSCHPSCRNCTGVSPNLCDECNTPTYISRDSFCVIDSPNAGCGYSVSSQAEDCIESEDGYYLATAAPSQVLPCTSPCASCVSGGTSSCTTCISHYYINSPIGVSNPSTYCNVCHDSCNLCTGVNAADCDDCAFGYLRRASDLSVCTRDHSCSPNCKYCYGLFADECIECITDFAFDGMHNCKSDMCVMNCEVCINRTEAGCTLCSSPFFFSNTHICVIDADCGENCNECIAVRKNDKCVSCLNVGDISYFLYKGLNISYCVTTIDCVKNCLYCLNSTTNGCIECNSGFAFMDLNSDRRCVTEISCGINCLKCMTPAKNDQCVSCLGDYSLYNSLNISYCTHAAPCILNCLQCIGLDGSNCIECINGYSLYHNMCVTDTNCGRNCEKCLAPNDDAKCVSCIDEFTLYHNEEISYCVTSNCNPNIHCAKCIANSSEDCLECAYMFHEYSVNNPTCVMEDCYTNCKYCYSSTIFECMECKNNTLTMYNDAPSLCGYKEECHPNCNFCILTEDNGCVSCKDGYGLYNNQFPSYCSTQNCHALCKDCLNETYCLTCLPTAQLGTDSRCRITCEAGYVFNFELPYCREICGDGLNMGQYECDDGNTIDGDGCDHNCMKEKGFLCTNGGIKDTCILPSYKIEYIEGMYKMRMVFNYAVENITSYLDKMKARIKRENGTTTQLNFLSSKVINDSSIEMELDLSDVEADGNEKLEFDMVSLLKHIGDNSSLNTTLLTIPALPIKKVVASKVGVAAPLACFGVAAIGGVVGAIFAKGISSSIGVVEFAQAVSLLALINVRKIPGLVLGMVKACSNTRMTFFPDIFKSTTKRMLSDAGGQLFLNCIMPFIFLIAAVALLYGFAKLMQKTKKCVKVTTKLLDLLEYGLFFRVLQIAEMPIALGIMSQLNKGKLGQTLGGVSLAIASLCLLGLVIWECGLVIFMFKCRIFLNSESYIKKYGVLYNQYKLTGKAIYTPAAQLCKKFIVCSIVFITSGFIQCSILVFASAGIIMWMLIVRPYKNRYDIWPTVLSEVFLLLGLVCYMLLLSPKILVYYIDYMDKAMFTFIGAAFAVKIAFIIFNSILSFKQGKVVEKVRTREEIEIPSTLHSMKSSSIKSTEKGSSNSDSNDKTIDETQFRTAFKYGQKAQQFTKI